MRFLKKLLVAIFILAIFSGTQAKAIDVMPPPDVPPKTDSPVIITGYMFSGSHLNYVQLFNNSDEVMDMTNWRLHYTVTGQSASVEIANLSGLLKPKGYAVVGEAAAVPSADFAYQLSTAGVQGSVNGIRLLPPLLYFDHAVTVKVDPGTDYWHRNISSSTGNYLSTFAAFTPSASFVLYGNGLYEYPARTPLQVAEVLPSPRLCSPTDPAGDCREYVKLYNPSAAAVDLSQLRLRVGYQGQTPSVGNTFLLSGMVDPGHYAVITTSADNRPVSLTNSGGFVWLEDRYGIQSYDTTIVEYPDASSDTKKGQAWAYDATDGAWKWTTQPMPMDGPSVFPVIVPDVRAARATSLTPCKEGQYRNEETNRCRSLASTASVLVPCDDDQERNPATGRCRKVATAASHALAPCKEGQERNPETNRCRNIVQTIPPGAAFAAEPIAGAGTAFVGWWALGGVGILAVGYGLWEWRYEIGKVARKVATSLKMRSDEE